MKARHLVVVLAFLALAGGSIALDRLAPRGGPADRASGTTPPAPSSSTVPKFQQLLPPDAIRPIYSPRFQSAAAAPLRRDELVIGVEILGHARAYPIEVLNYREIVDDRIGSVPLLVTWCPLCHTGIVYDRRLHGRELLFGNQGALYLNGMTWWDHQTHTVWSQVTGRALFGPLAGAGLRQIPASVEPWDSWRARHPETLVLDNGRGVPELLTRDFVIGIRLRGGKAAFSFPWVVARGVVNDEVGGVPVAIYARSDGVVRVFSRVAGGGAPLSLVEDSGRLVDRASGTSWDPMSGSWVGGPYAAPLVQLRWATFYPDAWQRFYPNARLVG